MDFIQVNNISKNYMQGEVEVHALKKVSFSIEPGEFTALTGPSGSGKTTMLNIMGALDLPNSGDVFLKGQCINQLSKKEATNFRLNHIGFVFQFYNLIPVFTALENVEYLLMLQGVSKKNRREKSLALLAEMGIDNLANRFPKELSGGQQQRVAVARAIVAEPSVVLADEPTANLDSESADTLLDIMESMCNKKGVTFIFSTHDPRVMERARRLLKLRDGVLHNGD